MNNLNIIEITSNNNNNNNYNLFENDLNKTDDKYVSLETIIKNNSNKIDLKPINNNLNKMIDIKKSNLEISQIKYPIIFLFKLITCINYIDDYDFSIILRIFLKYHSNIALTINLKNLFKLELSNRFISWSILNDFYKIINKKMSLIFILNKWHSVYTNKKFWKLSLNKQIDYLQNTKMYFLGIFDCSKGGIPFHYKVGPLLNRTNYNYNEIIKNIKDRLLQIYKIFGFKLYQTMDIPLLTVIDFYHLTSENLIKYLIIIFDKFNELLNQIIKLFDKYNLICIELDNLINPIIININTQNIDSETEFDDIKLYCN